jgi:hypothetical protein
MKVYDIVSHRSKEVKLSDIVGFVHTTWKPDRVRLWLKDPTGKSKKSLDGIHPHKDDMVITWDAFKKIKLNKSKLIWYVNEV